MLQPDAIALDRLARIQADQLVAIGPVRVPISPAKVGVLYFEDPAPFAAAEKVLEQELARRGVQVADRASLPAMSPSASDVGPTQTQVQNAVLRFRSEGITHVIGVETNAWLIGFFGVGAASQDYYPRYGYTSDEVLSNVAANVPARALEGARFVGWWPAQDVTDPASYPTAARRCLTFMRKHGFAISTGNQRGDALGACESISFLERALTAGGEPMSRTSLFTGARGLRTYQPTNTFRLRITARNYDGVSTIRQGRWDSHCGCFAYTSGLIPID